MKKFYTLAIAASVALAANAAVPATALSTTTLDLNSEVVVKNESHKAAIAKTLSTVAPAAANATPDQIAGEYFFVHNNDGVLAHQGVTTIEPGEGDQVILKGFMFTDSNDVPATISHNDEYNLDILTIASETVLFNQGTAEYSLLLFGYDGEQPSVYPDDIEFVISGNQLIFAYDDAGIAFIDLKTMRGGWFMNPLLSHPNGTMAWEDVDLTTSTPTFTPVEVPLYTEYIDGILGVFNFAGATNMVLFQVNTETGAATATQQVVYSSSAEGDFVLYDGGDDFDPNSSLAIINATLSNLGNGKSKLVIDTPNWWAFSDAGYYYFAGTGGELQFDFEIPTLPNTDAGINDVNIDNSNAPVEYFNLQGVRVANPENGLYIRRQGTDVTKVLVK